MSRVSSGLMAQTGTLFNADFKVEGGKLDVSSQRQAGIYFYP